MAIYAKITGAKQGAFKGAVTAASFSDQVHVNTVDFGVGSPHDVSTGLPSGKRVARPVRITKPLDKSSPLFHQSCTTNESLTVEISFVVEGQGHKPYATIKLTKAMIQDFDTGGAFDGSTLEKVSFTYTKIEFTWVEGGITSVDDWMASA
jgi:type VI secretion system secreted protein Hcp